MTRNSEPDVQLTCGAHSIFEDPSKGVIETITSCCIEDLHGDDIVDVFRTKVNSSILIHMWIQSIVLICITAVDVLVCRIALTFAVTFMHKARRSIEVNTQGSTLERMTC